MLGLACERAALGGFHLRGLPCGLSPRAPPCPTRPPAIPIPGRGSSFLRRLHCRNPDLAPINLLPADGHPLDVLLGIALNDAVLNQEVRNPLLPVGRIALPGIIEVDLDDNPPLDRLDVLLLEAPASGYNPVHVFAGFLPPHSRFIEEHAVDRTGERKANRD